MAGNPLLIPQDAIEPPLAQFLDAEHREAREAKAAAAIQPDMHCDRSEESSWPCSHRGVKDGYSAPEALLTAPPEPGPGPGLDLGLNP
ncbi:hypothetical protein CFAM422_000655 [Trichoderma lentiforme]|uniref:Uncharacterized protein n=1 Tax=Trichoderma lentiforme TaxID=1567552 RepID=A0A9P4XS71_9HYPO|nr:hypothetical protein CFAM422_000655 [Trichoderma lentiforme]